MDQSRLAKDLQRHEGLRLKPYHDSAGVLTIGFGHNLEEGIDKPTAVFMLQRDILAAERLARALVPPFWTFGDVRQEVIVNMVFNLGHRFKKFTRLRAALEAQNFEMAAEEMLDSKWAGQVGQRAVELAERMRTGEII